MSQLESKHMPAKQPSSPSMPAEHPDETGPVSDNGVDNAADIRADAELVCRCVEGEVAAWEELYQGYHPRLLRSIEYILGPDNFDPNLVDEMAARVWHALVAEDGELLARFDARRGTRLSTFMRAVARDLIGRHFRAERRRRNRERESCRAASWCGVDEFDETEVSFSELRDSLTPNEREFLDQHLAEEVSDEVRGRSRSSANIRKLTSRICRKVRSLFWDGKHGETQPAPRVGLL